MIGSSGSLHSEASKEEDLRGCLGCLREGDSPATNTKVGGGGAAPLWGGSHGSTIAGLAPNLASSLRGDLSGG